MNCFQTRKEFPNFWRQRLEPAPAAALTDHLERCGLCEQAFRLFALSAPVLYSEAETVEAMLEGRRRPARSTRSVAADRDTIDSHGMVWTALSMLIAASVIAYFSFATPNESLNDALTKSQASSAVSAVQEPPSSFIDDFAG